MAEKMSMALTHTQTLKVPKRIPLGPKYVYTDEELEALGWGNFNLSHEETALLWMKTMRFGAAKALGGETVQLTL